MQAGQGGGGSAQGAGYVEQVAGAGAGAEQGFAAGNRADENDIGDGDGRLGEVAASQRGFVGLGEGEQAVKEAGKPKIEQVAARQACVAAGVWAANSRGKPRERKAATGRAPMAARSLKPRARARWPMDSGGCQSRRK